MRFGEDETPRPSYNFDETPSSNYIAEKSRAFRKLKKEWDKQSAEALKEVT